MVATRNTTLGLQFLLLSSRNGRRKHGAAAKASSSVKKEKIEIRVCTNRTCRKQGSLEALLVFSGIAPPFVVVQSCGCLGRCGSGPNVVILPEGSFVGHCGTPTKVANTMAMVCGVGDCDCDDAANKCLQALALRKRAEEHSCLGEFDQACSLLSQGIDLEPFGGLHILYRDRSAARLNMGDVHGALEDAKEALHRAPYYAEAYLCEGDVLLAMNQFGAAEESYSIALDLEPSIRRSKSFKARIAKLQEKLTHTNSG